GRHLAQRGRDGVGGGGGHGDPAGEARRRQARRVEETLVSAPVPDEHRGDRLGATSCPVFLRMGWRRSTRSRIVMQLATIHAHNGATRMAKQGKGGGKKGGNMGKAALLLGAAGLLLYIVGAK